MLLLLLLLLPVQAKVQADYNLPNTSVITDGMGNVAATLPKMWVCTLRMCPGAVAPVQLPHPHGNDIPPPLLRVYCHMRVLVWMLCRRVRLSCHAGAAGGLPPAPNTGAVLAACVRHPHCDCPATCAFAVAVLAAPGTGTCVRE